MQSWHIEITAEESLAACLALLSPVNHPDAIVYSARDGDGTLIGAAGILWQSWGEPAGFPVWIHVLPDYRLRGAGRALLQAVLQCTSGETSQLWAATPLVEGQAAACFCLASGFNPSGRQLAYDADAAIFLQQVETIIERLRYRGRIPPEALIVDLEPGLIGPVAALVSRDVSSAPVDIEARLLRSLEEDPATAPIDRTRSKVLLAGNDVIGALLSRRQGDRINSKIVCNVVAPAWRKGWANVLLLEATTRAGVDAGCLRFSFDCDETARDTIGLAKRCGADLLRTQALFRYALANRS